MQYAVCQIAGICCCAKLCHCSSGSINTGGLKSGPVISGIADTIPVVLQYKDKGLKQNQGRSSCVGGCASGLMWYSLVKNLVVALVAPMVQHIEEKTACCMSLLMDLSLVFGFMCDWVNCMLCESIFTNRCWCFAALSIDCYFLFVTVAHEQGTTSDSAELLIKVTDLESRLSDLETDNEHLIAIKLVSLIIFFFHMIVFVVLLPPNGHAISAILSLHHQ